MTGFYILKSEQMFPIISLYLSFTVVQTGIIINSSNNEREVIELGSSFDGFLMVLIAAFFLYIGYRTFRTWVRRPFGLKSGIGLELNDQILEHPAVDLLEQAGFEVLSDKLKIPLAFQVDDRKLHSRLFIDYIAAKDGEFYLVRTARERMPVEWTGSGIRRDFLPFLLMYPECAGVLYVDAEQNLLKEITLTTDEDEDVSEQQLAEEGLWRTK